MDMMNSIAAASMSMSAMQFQQSYSVSVTKKAMEGMEEQAQELLEMLPELPTVQAPLQKGQYVNVRA